MRGDKVGFGFIKAHLILDSFVRWWELVTVVADDPLEKLTFQHSSHHDRGLVGTNTNHIIVIMATTLDDTNITNEWISFIRWQ